MNKEQFDTLESASLRWAVEARRKGRDEQQEQRRQAQQGQEKSKQGKQVRFGEEQQLGKTGAENAGEPEVMGGTTEVRTGRGSTGLVRGRDECRTDETSRKGKGKGNGGKGEHEGKGGGFGSKGFQQSVKEADEEDERDRVAPNMGGRWLTPPGHVGSSKGRRSEGRKRRRKERNPRDEMGQIARTTRERRKKRENKGKRKRQDKRLNRKG